MARTDASTDGNMFTTDVDANGTAEVHELHEVDSKAGPTKTAVQNITVEHHERTTVVCKSATAFCRLIESGC